MTGARVGGLDSANGKTAYPEQCAYRLFEAQAVRVAERPAVVCGTDSLSYGQLNERSDEIAESLRAANVGVESRVGIYMRRSVDMVAAVLGIHKAGGAYVPIDPAHPAERRSYVIADAELSALITQNSLLDSVPDRSDWISIPGGGSVNDSNGVQILTSRNQPKVRTEQRGDPTLENAAYAIYTSGSTGNPKGVEVLHRGLTNLLCSMARDFEFSESDTAFAVSTLAFDIATLDLLMPLICGGRVIIAPQEVARDAERLKEALRSSGATFVQATPATWRMLVESGWQGATDLKICSGGEALSRSLANELLERCGGLWNYYGPTETTIYSTGCRVERGEGPVPIGYPIANTQVYILDENQRAVSFGETGELFIGGDGLARGYLNQPDLTLERFPANPFEPQGGSRIYKTGDQVRLREDGAIEFLGRLDHQIKLRGFRIEPGDIEEHLVAHAAVRTAAVVAWEAESGDKQIAAYYVAEEGATPTASEFREFLSASLPEYMIPARFIPLKSMPLTPNGKLDRRALPDPGSTRLNLSSEYVPPSSEPEIKLAGIWSEVLGIRDVGVGDDFFEMGGHSLLAVTLLNRIEREFNIELPLIAIHQAPTIRRMSTLLSAHATVAQANSRVVQLAQGVRSPLFCVTGSGCDVLTMRELARHLGNARSVYALQPWGITGDADPLSSVEELARDYIQLIRTVLPQGPYNLVGYSAGGPVVFEIGRRLQARGGSIQSLILLDPTTPQRRAGIHGLLDQAGYLLKRGLYHVRKLSKISIREWPAYARQKTRFAVVASEKAREVLGDRMEIYDTTNQATGRYTPIPFRCSGLLIAATTRPDVFESDYSKMWPKLLQKGVTVRIVDGDHFGLLKSPAVREVAKEMIEYMDAGEATEAAGRS